MRGNPMGTYSPIHKRKLSADPGEDIPVSGTIHVTCGDCALDEALSISTKDRVSRIDDLSCGPLGTLNDLGSWCAMRQAYWDHPEGEPANSRKRRQQSKYATRDYIFGSLARLAKAHEVVIWLATRLAEQLALDWMPQLMRDRGAGRVLAHCAVHTEAFWNGDSI